MGRVRVLLALQVHALPPSRTEHNHAASRLTPTAPAAPLTSPSAASRICSRHAWAVNRCMNRQCGCWPACSANRRRAKEAGRAAMSGNLRALQAAHVRPAP